MKKFAAAILILFAASMISGAFATGCAAMPPAVADMQMESPSCCDLDAACAGGSCFARVRSAGCTSDHGSIAVAQKSEPPGDLAKALALTSVPAPSLVANVPRPRLRIGDPVCIASYADIFARTGRLII